MTSTGDQLVEEYLRRFDNASVFLTDERRAELRQEIVEHINAGTEEAEVVHAEAVRAALERLGPPADIVASETGSESAGSAPAVGQDPLSARETAHDGDGRPPQDGTSVAAPPARTRKFPLLLIGAVVTAVVIGALAFGMTGSAESGPQRREPLPTAPPQSGTSDSQSPSGPSEVSPGTSLPPSQQPTTAEETPTASSS